MSFKLKGCLAFLDFVPKKVFPKIPNIFKFKLRFKVMRLEEKFENRIKFERNKHRRLLLPVFFDLLSL